MKTALAVEGLRFFSETGNLDGVVYAQLDNDHFRNLWQDVDSCFWEHLAGDVWRTRMFSEE